MNAAPEARLLKRGLTRRAATQRHDVPAPARN